MKIEAAYSQYIPAEQVYGQNVAGPKTTENNKNEGNNNQKTQEVDTNKGQNIDTTA